MSFFFPAAFFLSVLGLGIVALYLRRNRRRRVEVSSTLFWQRVLDRQPNRRFLGRLRQPLSLLLQLLIFALLLLALAKPEFFHLPGQRSTLVILDTRARMQAESTFPKALAAAKQIVGRAGPGEEIALLNLGGEAMVLSPFSTRAKDLRTKLDAVRPTDGGGEIAPVVALAEKLLASRPEPRRLVVITDRPGAWPKEAEVVLTGESRPNIALLELAPRGLPASPQTTEIFLRAGNFSAEAREAEVELLLDDRTIDFQKLSIPAGEQVNFITQLPADVLTGSGRLTARLTAPDGLALDNEAHAVLDSAQPLRVLLLTKGNPFLENAIKADSAVKMEMLKPNQWRPTMSEGFDVTVFDDIPGQSIPAGNALFFGRSPLDVGDETLPVIAPESENLQHPLLRNVALAKARYGAAHRLNLAALSEGWKSEVVAESAGEPLLVAAEGDAGKRLIVAAWSATSSNLALKTDFPLFINNSLQWLAHRDSQKSNYLRAGETYLEAGQAPIFLARNGFFQSPSTAWLAVNTSDENESDLRTSQSTASPDLLLGRIASLQLWQWIALGALLLILVEWCFHHRRITE